jgi:hypothetical protein
MEAYEEVDIYNVTPYISYYSVMVLQSFVGPWQIFQFLNLYTVGRTPWTGDQSVARPLPTHRTTQTQNKHIQTSMPRVGLEPMTPVFQRAKTVYALVPAATVVGLSHLKTIVREEQSKKSLCLG